MNKMIDHTLLKANSTLEELNSLCEEAKKFNFSTVCITPCRVKAADKALKGFSVGICTVVGFPLGASTTDTKVFETKNAIKDGASEIDMVINIGALKDRDAELLYGDIKAVVDAAGEVCVKVIIETALLTDDEKVIACRLAEKAGAKFVKTSTGFASSGATLEDVKLMRQTVSEKIQVKASGGIRDLETAKAMVEAGATRLGTSSGVAIVQGETGTDSY